MPVWCFVLFCFNIALFIPLALDGEKNCEK